MTQWIAENQIKVLDWPGNSPDLNPIENLWIILKRYVKRHLLKNMQELIYYIKQVWYTEISPICVRNLFIQSRRDLGRSFRIKDMQPSIELHSVANKLDFLQEIYSVAIFLATIVYVISIF